MKRTLRVLLPSTLTGVLVALSDPGYGWNPWVWVAFIPLLWSMDRLSLRGASACGWWSGFIFNLLILHWLLALWDWATGFIVAAYVLLSALMALQWAVWAAFFRWLRTKSPALLMLGLPSLWVVLEYARGSGPFGFQWGVLGYDLYQYQHLVQLAAWTGVLGLSFLVQWVNAALYIVLQHRQWPIAFLVACTVLAVGLMGNWHRQAVRERMELAPRLELALIQPNIPQLEKSNPARLDSMMERYEALLTAVGQPVDVIVLPESILPTLVLDDDVVREKLLAHVHGADTAMLLGTFTRRAGDVLNDDVFNSAVLLSQHGSVLGIYDKVQLVPFSTESFPGIEWLNRLGLQRWLGPLSLGALTAGASFSPLQLNTVLIGTPICFESTFPGIGRAFVRSGAQLLVALTNDAWFKRSIELQQHFAMGTLRAVETGRAFVQVANTGTTGVSLPDGSVPVKDSAHQASTIITSVPLMQSDTPFVIFGDWFVGSALVLLVGVCARKLLQRA